REHALQIPAFVDAVRPDDISRLDEESEQLRWAAVVDHLTPPPDLAASAETQALPVHHVEEHTASVRVGPRERASAIWHVEGEMPQCFAHRCASARRTARSDAELTCDIVHRSTMSGSVICSEWFGSVWLAQVHLLGLHRERLAAVPPQPA